MSSSVSIGMVCDNDDYVESFNVFLGNQLTRLPLDASSIQSQNSYPQKLVIQSKEISFVIIYSSLTDKKRQMNYGLDWLREFRIRGFETPALILSWQNPMKLWYQDMKKSFFASPYFEESCSVFQLPVIPSQLEKRIRSLKPITIEQLEYGSSFVLLSWLRHLLNNLLENSNLDDIKQTVRTLTAQYPTNYIQKNVQQILNCSNVSEFRSLVGVLFK